MKSTYLRLVGIWLILGLTGLGRTQDFSEFETVTHKDEKGQTLPFRFLKPLRYDVRKQYPLVIFFHGAGERGNDNAQQLKHGANLFLNPENREKFPCFVVFPQCPNNQQWVNMAWSGDTGTRPAQPSDAMALALGIMDSVIANFKVDTNRLYATGLSMGGYATWDCVTRFPDRFAAGAPVCGGGDFKTVTPTVAKVPVWAFHSEDDKTVKVKRTRDMIKAMREAGGQPKYFEYFGLGHNSWGKALSEPEFLPWMFAQRRGQPDNYKLTTPQPELPKVAQWPEREDMFPGKGPVRTADWFKQLWQQRRLEFWQNRVNDRGAVVFLGDSITQGWKSLSKDFPKMKVANRGISGDTTRGVLFRLPEDVLDLAPAAIVLLVGTNDIEDGSDPEQVGENIRQILGMIRTARPQTPVVLCKVMPSSASKKRPVEKIQKLNSLLDGIIKADPLITPCDTFAPFANEHGEAKKEEFPDLLHPNAAGYAKWTEALQPILKKLNLGQ